MDIDLSARSIRRKSISAWFSGTIVLNVCVMCTSIASFYYTRPCQLELQVRCTVPHPIAEQTVEIKQHPFSCVLSSRRMDWVVRSLDSI